jgi:hypothetical protein
MKSAEGLPGRREDGESRVGIVPPRKGETFVIDDFFVTSSGSPQRMKASVSVSSSTQSQTIGCDS